MQLQDDPVLDEIFTKAGRQTDGPKGAPAHKPTCRQTDTPEWLRENWVSQAYKPFQTSGCRKTSEN